MEMLDKPGGGAIEMIFTTFLVTFLNAAFIGHTGSSIGKWFLDIKVLDSYGQPIGYKLALKREFKVWVYGWGFGIPLFTLVAWSKNYLNLRKQQDASWDVQCNTHIIYRKVRISK
jgi:uncharacterized RDD family membrane protein YckC